MAKLDKVDMVIEANIILSHGLRYSGNRNREAQGDIFIRNPMLQLVLKGLVLAKVTVKFVTVSKENFRDNNFQLQVKALPSFERGAKIMIEVKLGCGPIPGKNGSNEHVFR